MKRKRKTVFVGMSGGVDSSVSAAILKKEGYEVVGVFIKTWHPVFLECNEKDERLDAMRVAAHLDIPFLTFNLEEVYKNEVAKYMIEEYKKDRTPNPDVMCNEKVKFGGFYKKAMKMGADFVATGHYAVSKNGKMYKGKDASKDQSYFLWKLNKEQLERTLFPLGRMKKDEVRKIAKKYNLPVATKKDSQGICFLGKVNLKDFLKHYIKEKKGKVLNEKGEDIGFHNGTTFFTLGERHGFEITKRTPSDKPYYVVAKNIKNNTLTVSNFVDGAHGDQCASYKKNFLFLEKVNWTNGRPKENKNYTAQIRYHGDIIPCSLDFKDTSFVKVSLKKDVLVASGQSVVLYDGALVLGGGVVA